MILTDNEKLVWAAAYAVTISCDGISAQSCCTERLKLYEHEEIPDTWLLLGVNPLTGKPAHLCPRHRNRFAAWAFANGIPELVEKWDKTGREGGLFVGDDFEDREVSS